MKMQTLMWMLATRLRSGSAFSPLIPLRRQAAASFTSTRIFMSSKEATTTGDSVAPSDPLLQAGTNATVVNGETIVVKEAPPSYDFLAVDPHHVQICVNDHPDLEEPPVTDFKGMPFVSMFRGSANYIATHRGAIAVFHVPGGLLEMPGHIMRDLMNDISLTWLLGIKIVLVASCREQVRRRLGGAYRSIGMLRTDEEALRVVKEEAGYVRFEIERQLARSLRMQGGSWHASSKEEYFDGNVVSGNFYSAQPCGILDGVDYQYTGFVRRVETEKILQVINNRDICLLTPLGVSPSGEVFNCNSECLAATVAGALKANKIIFFTEKDVELRHKVHNVQIVHMRLKDAKNLLNYCDLRIEPKGYAAAGEKFSIEDRTEASTLAKLGWATRALELGVKRAHIISPRMGALLQELYTRDGSGTLISRDLYEGIRQAKHEDVAGLYELILPLIEMGILVDRPKTTLERDIESYYVMTRDNLIVACGQLKLFEGGYGEIGCLVVNNLYRKGGRGDAMLGYLERLCVQNGASKIFVLSTQTMEWFVERDFAEVGVEKLPPSRKAIYNYKRASKIYMKEIQNIRDLDASELRWDR